MSVTYNGAHSVAFVTKSSSGAISVTKSWDDLFLIPAKRLSVTPAQPNYAIVSIPGSSKRIDLSSQISGTLTYSGRSGSWDFYVDHDMYSNWAYTLRRLSTLLNGKRMVCVLRDDPSYPYSGRVILKDWRDEETYSTVSIEYDFDYVYDGSIDVTTLTNSVQWAAISDASGTATIVRAQEKTVSPIVAQQIIEPDRILGYNYLAKVTVKEIPYKEVNNGNNGGKTAMIACEGQSGTPSPGSAAAIKSQTKTVTPQSTDLVVVPDSGYDYLSRVTVKGVTTSATPKTQSKTVKPDETAKTVVPDSGYDYLSQVNVLAISAQNKTVTPGTEAITVRPDNGYDYLKSVLVEKAIDTANINVQTKTVKPTSEVQEIVPDSGYDYLSKVTVLGGSAEDDEEELEPYTGDETIFYVDIPDVAGVDLGLPNIASESLDGVVYHIYQNGVHKTSYLKSNGERLVTTSSFPSGECEIEVSSYGVVDGVAGRYPNIPHVISEYAQNYNSQYNHYIKRIDFGNISTNSVIKITTYGLKTIRFKDSTIISIASQAFSGCHSLTSVVIPQGVTSIGSYAFGVCYSLTSVVIPQGATSIGDNAFEGCYSLTSVVIPQGVTSIGRYAFSCCYSLTSVIIPQGVTSIEDRAFGSCYSLTSVVIPQGVTSIGGYAFAYCYSLAYVVIPQGVTSIGGNAFRDCYSLTSVVIPQGVTSIGSYAFSDCYSIKTIIIKDSTPSSVITPSIFPTSSAIDCKFYVLSSAVEAYKSAEGWSDYADKIFPIPEEGS